MMVLWVTRSVLRGTGRRLPLSLLMKATATRSAAEFPDAGGPGGCRPRDDLGALVPVHQPQQILLERRSAILGRRGSGCAGVRRPASRWARTVEIDNRTLADVDLRGWLVGVEVLRPDREWPLDDILSKFHVDDRDERDLRAAHKSYRHRSRGRRGGTLGAAAVVGIVAIAVIKAMRDALSRIPIG
jgi:hypothetical protein